MIKSLHERMKDAIWKKFQLEAIDYDEEQYDDNILLNETNHEEETLDLDDIFIAIDDNAKSTEETDFKRTF